MEAALVGHTERGESVLMVVVVVVVVVEERHWKLSIPPSVQEVALELKSGRDFKTVLRGERERERDEREREDGEGERSFFWILAPTRERAQYNSRHMSHNNR